MPMLAVLAVHVIRIIDHLAGQVVFMIVVVGIDRHRLHALAAE